MVEVSFEVMYCAYRQIIIIIIIIINLGIFISCFIAKPPILFTIYAHCIYRMRQKELPYLRSE